MHVGQSDQITITISAAGKTTKRIILLTLSVKVLERNNPILKKRVSVINERLPLEGWAELGNQHEHLAPSTSPRRRPFLLWGLKSKEEGGITNPGDREATNRSYGHLATLSI